MADTFIFIILGIIFLFLIIFGYADDYRRNPREFIATIVAVPLAFLSTMFGFLMLLPFIKSALEWFKKER